MRLIDADTIFNGNLLMVRAEAYDAVHAVIEKINNAPTVDAEPVRHGRWIYDFSSPLKCSSCGIVSKANEITLRTDFKFCPYCGAKMDEVEDE